MNNCVICGNKHWDRSIKNYCYSPNTKCTCRMPSGDGRFISIYEVSRYYGGAEEGGWWYNAYQCLKSKPIPNCSEEDRDAIIRGVYQSFAEEFSENKRGDIYSALGGTDILIMLEDYPGERESMQRPRYE